MTDERLQDLLKEAKDTYRVPAEPPLDAMWARIEREHFEKPRAPELGRTSRQAPGRRAPVRRWLGAVAGIAATLAVGVGIGRYTAPPAAPPALPLVADAAQVTSPLQRTTYEYLDETVALLGSLPADGQRRDPKFQSQAVHLLGTTRLLLDSPAATDPRLRDLLEDLELVLAQVARLRPQPRAEELHFIAEAMDERDVVPRLRVVAASLSTPQF
jgi:hypothetical protein